jgi:hypothetical protein
MTGLSKTLLYRNLDLQPNEKVIEVVVQEISQIEDIAPS